VLRMVIRHGMAMTVLGIVIGMIGAFALTRMMTSMLFNTTPTDPLTFLSVAGVLLAVALLACYVPANRATKVDPLEALRYE